MSNQYEYRVVDVHGRPYPSHPTFFEYDAAKSRADNLDKRTPKWGPHRVQRSPRRAWEDVLGEQTP